MTLRNFDLTKGSAPEQWRLLKEGAARALRTFPTKAIALAEIEAALGRAGGSVRIRKEDGSIQEERTYPRSADPRRSLG